MVNARIDCNTADGELFLRYQSYLCNPVLRRKLRLDPCVSCGDGKQAVGEQLLRRGILRLRFHAAAIRPAERGYIGRGNSRGMRLQGGGRSADKKPSVRCKAGPVDVHLAVAARVCEVGMGMIYRPQL